MKSIQEQLAFDITMSMMKNRGWDPENPVYELEFDPSEPTSQFSLIHEDVEYILNYIYQEVDDDDEVDAPPSNGLSVSTIIDFHLGEGSSVGDLRTLVSHLNDLQVPDEYFISGQLSVVLLNENTWVSKITCGECGMDDILVMTEEHSDSGCGSDEEIESFSAQPTQTQPSYTPSWTGYSANLPDPNNEIVISTDDDQLKLY